MKKSRAVEVLAFCMVAISLFSCTSIDKSDLSSVLGENRMAFELLPTSNDAAVTTLVPRFVFTNSDKRSLTIMADTLGPQYHLRVDLLFVGDTYEIVALRLSNAVEQTGWKIVGTRFYRTRTQPKECSVLTEEELQRVFSRIVANSCDKDNRPDRYPCIPFGYATDGCLARAHAMRRLINSLGYECHKAFMRYGLICKKYAHSSSLAENGWAYIMVRLQHFDAAGQRHGVAVDFEREVGVVVSEVSDKEPEVLLHEFRLQLAVDGYALERLAVGKRRFTDFRDVG